MLFIITSETLRSTANSLIESLSFLPVAPTPEVRLTLISTIKTIEMNREMFFLKDRPTDLKKVLIFSPLYFVHALRLGVDDGFFDFSALNVKYLVGNVFYSLIVRDDDDGFAVTL